MNQRETLCACLFLCSQTIRNNLDDQKKTERFTPGRSWMQPDVGHTRWHQAMCSCGWLRRHHHHLLHCTGPIWPQLHVVAWLSLSSKLIPTDPQNCSSWKILKSISTGNDIKIPKSETNVEIRTSQVCFLPRELISFSSRKLPCKSEPFFDIPACGIRTSCGRSISEWNKKQQSSLQIAEGEMRETNREWSMWNVHCVHLTTLWGCIF